MSLRGISPNEVALHNTERDCWIIVNGKVYEVTKYLNDHPGGVDIVTELAGKDATADYDDVGHTQEAHDILEKFVIGKLSNDVPVPVKATTSTESPKPPVVVSSTPQPEVSKPFVKQIQKIPEPESDNTMLMVGVAFCAVAAVGYMLFKKSRE